MGAKNLAEIIPDLVNAKLKLDFFATLADIKTERNTLFGGVDFRVNPTVPQSYFNYSGAKGYKVPAIFTVVDSGELRKERGTNYVHCFVVTRVHALIEEKTEDLATRLTWRYQDAIDEILDQTSLTSSDSKVRLFLKVKSFEFSPLYSSIPKESGAPSVFRKEVGMTFDVETVQSF